MSLPPPPDGSSPPPYPPQQPYPLQQPYPSPPQAPFAPQPGYPPQQYPPQPGYAPQQPNAPQWGQQPAYPTYTPPPLKVARPPLVMVALVCGLGVALGSVLSWVRLADGSNSVDYGGLHKDGKLTVVMAAIVIGAMIMSLTRAISWPMITATVMFALSLGVALLDIADVQSKNTTLNALGANDPLSTGVGLWLVLVFSIVGVIGAIVGLVTRAAPTT